MLITNSNCEKEPRRKRKWRLPETYGLQVYRLTAINKYLMNKKQTSQSRGLLEIGNLSRIIDYLSVRENEACCNLMNKRSKPLKAYFLPRFSFRVRRCGRKGGRTWSRYRPTDAPRPSWKGSRSKDLCLRRGTRPAKSKFSGETMTSGC